MRSTATRSETRNKAKALDPLVAALQRGVCDEDAARALYALGPDAVTLALLAAARRITEQDAALILRDARIGELQRQVMGGSTPSTSSGMVPVHAKPNAPAGCAARGRRRKRPGAREGHPGTHRPTPTRIDERKEHRLSACPCCGD